ncbi:MAG: hypothetical protein RJQ01_09415 [Microcella sp.]|uniref:hypothetical protein n=1 Tax=Microcella sp. TaxID=1913979 RepID=UPI0033160E87
MTVSEREARARALEAVARMRSEGLSLTEATRRANTTPSTVRRWAADALSATGRRTQARPVDRLYRRMHVVSWDGRATVDVRGSRAASRVGRHWQALDAFLADDDSSGLRRLRGARVGGVELLTDLERIKELVRAGELFGFESIYAQVA